MCIWEIGYYVQKKSIYTKYIVNAYKLSQENRSKLEIFLIYMAK